MSSLIPIIVIIAIAAIGIPIYLKKKKGKTANLAISQRKNKDEVWKAVKQFLKDNDEHGKEIIDCYVAKRNALDYVNPNLPKYVKERKREEIKIRKWQFEQQKKAMRAQGKKLVHPKEKDLYIVCFTTKETRDGKVDRPRCIECEVTNTRIDKKNWDRKILIHGEADYDKEMEWIAPLKFAEKIKNERAVKQQEKAEAKKQQQILKKKQKTKAKIDKAKQKAQTEPGA